MCGVNRWGVFAKYSSTRADGMPDSSALPRPVACSGPGAARHRERLRRERALEVAEVVEGEAAELGDVHADAEPVGEVLGDLARGAEDRGAVEGDRAERDGGRAEPVEAGPLVLDDELHAVERRHHARDGGLAEAGERAELGHAQLTGLLGEAREQRHRPFDGLCAADRFRCHRDSFSMLSAARAARGRSGCAVAVILMTRNRPRQSQIWVSYAFCGFRIRIVVYWPHVSVDDCDDDVQGP